MQQFIDVTSSVKPEAKIITDTIVDINTNIRETVLVDEMSGTSTPMWVCDTKRYSLSEYLMLSEQQNSTGTQDLQMAITELTILLGGMTSV